MDNANAFVGLTQYVKPFQSKAACDEFKALALKSGLRAEECE